MSANRRRMPRLAFFAIPFLVRRSLSHHRLSTVVTVISTALASGLVLAVFSLQSASERAFTGGPLGFSAVLGARGSALQLVLNAVFHLETSPGNLPWSMVEAIARTPGVERAIPYALGDNFRGHRIVGTTEGLFHRTDAAGRPYLSLARGRLFGGTAREAVIGDLAARRTGLDVGSRFRPYHGLAFDEQRQHGEEFVVVGVLHPSQTPADRVLWIPLEGIFRLDGHVLRGTGAAFRPEPGREIPDEHKEVSAVMLDFKSAHTGFLLDRTINKQGAVATLAWPIGAVMADLFEKLGWMGRVLGLVAGLVAVVAAASVLASIHNALLERRREFAIYRALGARRWIVSTAVILEATAIGAVGAALGFGVYGAIFAVVRGILRDRTGVVLEASLADPLFALAPLAIVALSAVAGVLPAVRAYARDPVQDLAGGEP